MRARNRFHQSRNRPHESPKPSPQARILPHEPPKPSHDRPKPNRPHRPSRKEKTCPKGGSWPSPISPSGKDHGLSTLPEKLAGSIPGGVIWVLPPSGTETFSEPKAPLSEEAGNPGRRPGNRSLEGLETPKTPSNLVSPPSLQQDA